VGIRRLRLRTFWKSQNDQTCEEAHENG